MFDLWKKPPIKCSHPKWELVREVNMPSVAEQMQLETLPPEEKIKVLERLQPSDFNKSFLLIMSCPFCGEMKEFKTEQVNEERECNHQWEMHDTHLPSNFEKTCGGDATFEQRRQVAAKMEPNDFTSSVQRRMVCKVCGEFRDDYFSEEREGSSSRCSHQWKPLVGDSFENVVSRYEKELGKCKEVRIAQSVILTCEICGATNLKEIKSVIKFIPEKGK